MLHAEECPIQFNSFSFIYIYISYCKITILERNPNHTTPYEQALDDSGKDKLPLAEETSSRTKLTSVHHDWGIRGESKKR